MSGAVGTEGGPIGAALAALADKALRALDGSYLGGVGRRPVVEVFASGEDGERLTVRFVFDFVLYHYAQSGSDWDTHHIYAGEAVFVSGVQVSASVQEASQIVVHEVGGSTDWYAPEAAVREVRDAALAALGKTERA